MKLVKLCNQILKCQVPELGFAAKEKKKTDDVLMVTKEGARIWKSITQPLVWEEQLDRGGKITDV